MKPRETAMNPLLKWGMIAGAGLLLFKDQLAEWFGSDAQPAATPPATTPPVTAPPASLPPGAAHLPYYPPPGWTMQPPAQAPAVYYPPVTTPNPSVINQLPLTEEIFKKASYDENTAALLGNRQVFNVHEWNWYAEQAGLANPGDLSASGFDPNVDITALDYIYRRRQFGAGLSGIHATGRFVRR